MTDSFLIYGWENDFDDDFEDWFRENAFPLTNFYKKKREFWGDNEDGDLLAWEQFRRENLEVFHQVSYCEGSNLRSTAFGMRLCLDNLDAEDAVVAVARAENNFAIWIEENFYGFDCAKFVSHFGLVEPKFHIIVSRF